MDYIMFSRQFPKGHPRAGQPTYFVEQVWKSLYKDGVCDDALSAIIGRYMTKFEVRSYNEAGIKFTTIRAGNNWKTGDIFSARVWSGLPYRSKQVEFAQVEVKEAIPFSIVGGDYFLRGTALGYEELKRVAGNDGLSVDDFESWFAGKDDFHGQVIAWKEGLYK